MGDDIDSELAANVKAAKTKRMQFAFVPKGGSDGALVLSKTKISPVLITAAKKKTGGSQVIHGECFGEDGKLVFEMAGDPPGTMEAALKKVVMRDAGVSQHCVCRSGKNPESEGKGSESTETGTPPQQQQKPQPKPVTTTQTPKPQTTPQKSPTQYDTLDLSSKYSSLEKELAPQLTKALKEKQGDTEKMKSVFNFARDNAGKKNYEKAIQGLSALRGLLPTGYSDPSTTGKVPYTDSILESETSEHESEEKETGKPKMPYDLAGDIPTAGNHYTAAENFKFDETEDGSQVEDGSEVDDGSGWEDSDVEEEGEEEFAEAQLSEEEQKKKKKAEERKAVDDLRVTSRSAQKKLAPQVIESEWGKSIDLSGFKTKKVLGQGAFGATELLQQKGQKPLVIKVPLEESGVEDLQKEVDFYKKVGEHPNFVKCLGITDVDGQRGLVLEAVKGKDMGKSMKLLKDQYASGKLSHEQYWGAVQHTMRQTLEAIAHLESVGVVHNDIRMDNIMCDEETGQMKVLDFGISLNTGETISKAPIGYGTTSPDSYTEKDEHGKRQRKGVDSKHDAFSVGAATYEAGEGQQFDYHSGKKMEAGWQDLFKFADPDKEGNRNTAIRSGDTDNPAFTMEKKRFKNEMKSDDLRKQEAEEEGYDEPDDAEDFTAKTPQKVAGRSGANTAYTDFVNLLMHPDPSKRLSPAEALKHPFLADSLMDEEQARKVFQSVLAPPKKQGEIGGESGGEEEEEEEVETSEQIEAREKYTDKGYTAEEEEEEEEETSEQAKAREKYTDSGYSAKEEEEEEEEEESTKKSSGGGGSKTKMPENPQGYGEAPKGKGYGTGYESL